MNFVLASKESKAIFCVEERALKGVKRIVDCVREDARLVTGQTFECVHSMSQRDKEETIVFVGTIGYSDILDNWEREGIVDFSDIKGKREVYAFRFLMIGMKKILMIAGSDKRGTIYGAFHLSELLGVSPWVYFADVLPQKKSEVILTSDEEMISKEPSVKYRGIFINDEWPSFGNWTFEKWGGFTAQMYEHVFELILRLKGNYLWPAMWSSNFSLDGPGLENAILADEMGIVMSNSHHEPCLRHSEEWDMVKGKDTPYGTEWNFDRNKEGLKEYWRGGLLRNGKFENIITMGMRGERDSEILGHEASLQENIQYLKDVLVTQNELIKETISEDISTVPRMIALYKEVEAYYYGDENTQGLRGYEELDGVTLMLCEDNFGNMRYLPTEEERNHPGGYGMYYHFDYHGGPVSYEWVNSTSLTKVWEQMTQAYESGVSEIWIVNVGDLKPQELPISYFMDLAYDYERYGIRAINSTNDYLKEWVHKQFLGSFSENECETIAELLEKQTRINHIYKPEAMKPETVHPVKGHLSDRLIEEARGMLEQAEELLQRRKLKTELSGVELLSDNEYAAFYQLVHFPVCASMNQLLWNLYAGKNHYYAKLGATVANLYAQKMQDCNLKDEELKMIYHSVMDGKWNHMMSSEHVGFINWNDEDARLPIRYLVDAKKKPRMIVSATDVEGYSIGTDWTDKHLHLYQMCDPKCDQITLSIANGALDSFSYEIKTNQEWITLSKKTGIVELEDFILLTLSNNDRSDIPSTDGYGEAVLEVKSAFATVYVHVHVLSEKSLLEEKNVIPAMPADHKKSAEQLKLVIEADDYEEKLEGQNSAFVVLKPFGKYVSGVKAFPINQVEKENGPKLVYQMFAMKEEKVQITFHLAPSNPLHSGEAQKFAICWNEENDRILSSVSESFAGGDTGCAEWAKGVLQNEHIVTTEVTAHAGRNRLYFSTYDQGVVLERIEISVMDEQL